MNTTDRQTWSLHRRPVFRYRKSGRLVATVPLGDGAGGVVELTDTLDGIRKIARQDYMRASAVETTDYTVEFEVSTDSQGADRLSEARLLRTLTSSDIDPDRWRAEPDLTKLPVSPHADLTPEERAWAGERGGTVHRDVATLLVATGLGWLAFQSYGNDALLGAAVFGITSAAILFALRRAEWRLPKRMEPARVAELTRLKDALRADRENGKVARRTAFDARLATYEGWRDLDPDQFERAVARTLEKDGFREVRVTQASKDGGIDVEAIDPNGLATIVQAKRHTSKVGVATIREMIGVRAQRADAPRVIVFALSGFTRGAKDAADSGDVELRDAHSLVFGNGRISA